MREIDVKLTSPILHRVDQIMIYTTELLHIYMPPITPQHIYHCFELQIFSPVLENISSFSIFVFDRVRIIFTIEINECQWKLIEIFNGYLFRFLVLLI